MSDALAWVPLLGNSSLLIHKLVPEMPEIDKLKNKKSLRYVVILEQLFREVTHTFMAIK